MYTILNEKQRAMNEKGNYLLAIVKEKESYDILSVGLPDLAREMEQLKEIKAEGSIYKIEYFLGRDWKFLASVCGIGAANGDYACIWCKRPKLQRHDINKVSSIMDTEFGTRTLNEIRDNSKSKKCNCIHAPLFPFIPLNHIIIDSLCLYLRICDNLIQLLIRQLKVCDAIDKKKTFTDNFARHKYKHMAGYEGYLQSIGILFHFTSANSLNNWIIEI